MKGRSRSESMHPKGLEGRTVKTLNPKPSKGVVSIFCQGSQDSSYLTSGSGTRFPSNPLTIRVPFSLIFGFNKGTPNLKGQKGTTGAPRDLLAQRSGHFRIQSSGSSHRPHRSQVPDFAGTPKKVVLYYVYYIGLMLVVESSHMSLLLVSSWKVFKVLYMVIVTVLCVSSCLVEEHVAGIGGCATTFARKKAAQESSNFILSVMQTQRQRHLCMGLCRGSSLCLRSAVFSGLGLLV